MRQLGEIAKRQDTRKGAREFAEYARLLAASGGSTRQMLRMAQASDVSSRVYAAVQQKAEPGTTFGPAGSPSVGWGSALVDFASAFVESLRDASAFDQLIPAMRPLPLLSRVVVASAISAGTVAESATKLVRSGSFSASTNNPLKVVSIIALSRELLRTADPAAAALLESELRSAVARASDVAFIEAILDGVVPVEGGSPGPSLMVALRSLLEAVPLDARSQPRLIVSPTAAASIAMMEAPEGVLAFPGMSPTGGTLAGVPVVISGAVSAATMILVDASQIGAAPGTVQIDQADAATLAMADDPESEPSLTSLWQANLAAVRCERLFAAATLRAGAVQFATDVTFGGS